MARQLQRGTVDRCDQQHGRYNKKRMKLPGQQKRRSRCAAGMAACVQLENGVENQQCCYGNDIGEEENVDKPGARGQH